MSTIHANDFEARCLEILDEVAATGEPVVILKRGKPVARLVPPFETSSRFSQTELVGTVTLDDDAIEPALPSGAWNAERGDLV